MNNMVIPNTAPTLDDDIAVLTRDLLTSQDGEKRTEYTGTLISLLDRKKSEYPQNELDETLEGAIAVLTRDTILLPDGEKRTEYTETLLSLLDQKEFEDAHDGTAPPKIANEHKYTHAQDALVAAKEQINIYKTHTGCGMCVAKADAMMELLDEFILMHEKAHDFVIVLENSKYLHLIGD